MSDEQLRGLIALAIAESRGVASDGSAAVSNGHPHVEFRDDAIAVLGALRDAGYRFTRHLSSLDCYECGKPVTVGQAYETHGRAGRVHQSCLALIATPPSDSGSPRA